MSTKEAIQKYRSELRNSRQEAPLKGIWVRSHREFVAIWITLLAVIAAVVIPVSIYQYSVLMQIAVPVAVALPTIGVWFAWIVWGRDAYPLPQK